MSDLNSFYYDLLHIDKSSNYQKVQRIVQEDIKNISNHTTTSDGLCKVYANNISISLTESNIDNMIINLNSISDCNYDHEFVIATIKEQQDSLSFVLIDPSYSQFENQEDKILRDIFTNWPSDILSSSEGGRKMLEDLKEQGLTIIDDNKLDLYVSSFGFNNQKSLNDLFIETIKSK